MAVAGELALGAPIGDETDALAIARGVRRLLAEMGYATLIEMKLASGRRADVIGLDRRGRFAIVEVKSSAADLRADRKWPDYLKHCDRFYFAVAGGFRQSLLPAETGIIVADRYGGEVMRRAPDAPMNGTARRAQAIRFARYAAARLRRFEDPPL